MKQFYDFCLRLWGVLAIALLTTVPMIAQRSQGGTAGGAINRLVGNGQSLSSKGGGTFGDMFQPDKVMWGWKGHYFINLKAAVDLPESMGWFKADSSFFQANASKADGAPYRDYSDTSFGAGQWQHFLNLDWYPDFHHLTHNLDSLITLYDSVTVKRLGTNPWAVKWWLDSLTAQLARGDTNDAKMSASLLGHFVADGHQPLHCTANYDGKSTGNTGIHSRYESAMLNSSYGDSIFVFPEFPHYIPSPVDTVFDYMDYSQPLVDSIMAADDSAKSVSGGSYSQAYYDALWNKTRYFTQDLWQRSSVSVASFWYTAWLNAFPEQFMVNRRWNMISLPRRVPIGMKEALFPTSISSAFDYVPGAGYVVKDTLVAGSGYWLKFDSTRSISVVGDTIAIDTISVSKGWNLIGSISSPIAVSEITSIPGGLVTSNAFEYDRGYHIVDSIKPGCGYWIKVSSASQLILSSSGALEKGSSHADRIRIAPANEQPPQPPDPEIAGGVTVPKEYGLEQNYPNPFNPTTTMRYTLPADSRIKLTIYTMLGQIVDVLVDGMESAGYKSVEWNAGSVSSGIYFYRVSATSTCDPTKSFTQVKKMLLLK